ncbi:hypothetical protein XA68_11463 [Ophiocordyceps unilateralis]|uniref:Uncharacterized protein n=1 Tax=Ophiocordyceps unilateralis TaxID=268505 RepID=A0A2A9PFK0_OPHUN|nr:hypothetical protein XA68_11463 [Ophiocordyceps unilateralis]
MEPPRHRPERRKVACENGSGREADVCEMDEMDETDELSEHVPEQQILYICVSAFCRSQGGALSTPSRGGA